MLLIISIIFLITLGNKCFSQDSLLKKINSSEIKYLSKSAHNRLQRNTYQLPATFQISNNVTSLLKSESFHLGELVEFPIQLLKNRHFIDQKSRIRWSGTVEGDPRSQVHITYNQKKSLLSAQLSFGGQSFQLTAIGSNISSSTQLKRPKGEGDFHNRFHKKNLTLDTSPYSASPLSTTPLTGSTVADKYVDVMILYTSNVAAALADPAGEAQTRIDATNTMLANSCVGFRYRLVHTEQIVHTETGALSTDLAALQNGTISGADALRTAQGADLVQLWVESNSENTGGLANAPTINFDENYGFSVLWRGFSNDITMAHELGHNLGLHHDRYQVAIDLYADASYLDGYGYVDTANKIRSVMSYSTQCSAQGISCPDARLFSNPNKIISGIPFGIQKYADATSKLNSTFSYVAAYQSATSSVSVPAVSESSCITSEDNKELHCFIATAAFDSTLHPFLGTFREFRDNHLLPHYPGKKLVRLYYQYSPSWAKVITEHASLKKLTRIILTPLAYLLKYSTFVMSFIGLIILFKSKKIFLAFLLFLIINFSAFSRYAGPTFFDDDILINPAATSWRVNSFFALSYLSSKNPDNYDNGSAGEKIQSGFNLKLATTTSPWPTEMQFTSTQTKTNRNARPKYSTIKTSSLYQLNLATKFTPNTALGLKILNNAQTSNSVEATKKLILGVGSSFHFGSGLFLGAGSDITQISGETTATAKWAEIYISALLVNPQNSRLELALIKAPEVKQIDDDQVFIKGSQLTTHLAAESFINSPLWGIKLFILGVEYQSESQSKVSNITQGKSSTQSLSYKLALQFSDSLQGNLKYQKSTIKVGDLEEKDTKTSLAVVFKL